MSVTEAAPVLPATAPRRRQRQLLTALGVLAFCATVPLWVHDTYTLNLLIITILYAGLAQAWNVLGGYCGQISLGHALYFGIGGYISTLLFVRLGVPPTLGMFVGGVGGAVSALLVGWPCFRLSGHYYAIATIVVAEMGYLLFLNWDAVGAATGLYVPIGADSWLYMQFRTTKLPFYVLAVGYAAACWLAAFLVEGSRWGFFWRAVRDDPIAARSLTVRVFPSKMAAAFISGGLTGIGGAIYAQYVGYIDPDSMFASSLSILVALPAVIGGVGSIWGPLIGAAVLIPVSELTRSYAGGSGRGVDLMIYGGLIVVIALARPAGLVSLLPERKVQVG